MRVSSRNGKYTWGKKNEDRLIGRAKRSEGKRGKREAK